MLWYKRNKLVTVLLYLVTAKSEFILGLRQSFGTPALCSLAMFCSRVSLYSGAASRRRIRTHVPPHPGFHLRLRRFRHVPGLQELPRAERVSASCFSFRLVRKQDFLWRAKHLKSAYLPVSSQAESRGLWASRFLSSLVRGICLFGPCELHDRVRKRELVWLLGGVTVRHVVTGTASVLNFCTSERNYKRIKNTTCRFLTIHGPPTRH